jgi:photosystem II stability/assembly factor-like uncharacterized protein
MRYFALAALAAFSAGGGWEQKTLTTASFRGLSVVNSKVVWISGSRATVVRTEDGGKSWQSTSMISRPRLDLRDIHAFDAKTAIAMSAGEADSGFANILRTVDGGVTWKTVFATDIKGVFFDAISFWDDKNGIIQSDPVDKKLFLLTTNDGGLSWKRVDPAALPEMLEGEAAFAASGTAMTVQGTSNVWIATGGAKTSRVFRSTDRGLTWAVSETPIHSGDGGAAGAFSIAFTDAKRGVTVGGNYSQPRVAYPNVALTEDGGVTWKAATGPTPPGYLSAVAYQNGNRDLIAVGLVGTATSSDGGNSWKMVDTIGYNAVAFANRKFGFAVGDRGRIAKWKP